MKALDLINSFFLDISDYPRFSCIITTLSGLNEVIVVVVYLVFFCFLQSYVSVVVAEMIT